MSWWCRNDGSNWTWAWRPYAGSWLIVAIAAIALFRAGTWRRDVETRRKLSAALGLILMLVGLDWPLAKLGAGYLVSAQMIRQVTIVMIATPLLLFGAPPALGEWMTRTPRRRTVMRAITHPLFSLVTSVTLIVGASLPILVDPMVKTQVGSFALDAAWIAAGFIIWLPVQPPRPITPRMRGVGAIVYLIGVSVAPLPVAFFMSWSDYPIYHVYELSPRVFPKFDALDDQNLAAAIFQVGGGLVIWAQIVVRFVRMATRESSGPKFRGTFVGATK